MVFTSVRQGEELLKNPELDGNDFFWEAGPVGVLLTHGFTATTAEVQPLARRLQARGYTVAGPLLPGHFRDPGELNRVHWQDWAAAVERMYLRLAERCEVVFVGGESTGGILALYLASQRPEIAGLLLYAPAIRLTQSPIHFTLLRFAAPFVPWINKRTRRNIELWQGYTVLPLKGAVQFARLQKEVQRRLPLVRQPVLICQGRLDPSVHPLGPELIATQVASTVKEIHWMDNSGHIVVMDEDLSQVEAVTVRFIQKLAGETG